MQTDRTHVGNSPVARLPASKYYWLAPAGASLAAVAGADTAGPLCAAPLTAAAPLAWSVDEVPERLQPANAMASEAAHAATHKAEFFMVVK